MSYFDLLPSLSPQFCSILDNQTLQTPSILEEQQIALNHQRQRSRFEGFKKRPIPKAVVLFGVPHSFWDKAQFARPSPPFNLTQGFAVAKVFTKNN